MSTTPYIFFFLVCWMLTLLRLLFGHSSERLITPRLKDGIASKFHRTETQLFLAPNGSNNDHKKFWKISLGPLRDFSILRILTPQRGKMGYYIELIIEKLKNNSFKLLFKSYWRNRIKGRLQKKKVQNLGHCPNRGGGGPTPRIERPNLLKWSDTKNWPKLFSQPQVEKKFPLGIVTKKGYSTCKKRCFAFKK